MRSRLLRWLLWGVGGLLGLVLLSVAVVYAVSAWRLSRTYAYVPPPLAVPEGLAAVEAGRRLVAVRGCLECHGADLGGAEVLDNALIGRIYGANLTTGAGGIGAQLSAEAIERAVRHGIGRDGKSLVLMPSHELYPLSDADVGRIVAYVRSVPPVDRAVPPVSVGPVARALIVSGFVPLLPAEHVPHDAPRPAAPEPGPTAAYGAYLATGCVGCHGAGFSGGRIPATPPEWPPAANLTPDASGLAAWSEADFVRALRTGIRPDGRALNEVMPWRNLAQLTDAELHALWLFLHSLPPRPAGEH